MAPTVTQAMRDRTTVAEVLGYWRTQHFEDGEQEKARFELVLALQNSEKQLEELIRLLRPPT